MDKIKVSKQEAAKRQINTAIKCFFNDEDILSIHTLACAGLGIIEDLARKKHQPTSFSAIIDLVIPERRREIENLFKKPQNFLKHADRDPDDILEYNPDLIDVYILLSCLSYQELTHEFSPEMKIYMLWFSFVYPNIISYDKIPGWRKRREDYINKWGIPKSPSDKSLMLKLLDQIK